MKELRSKIAGWAIFVLLLFLGPVFGFSASIDSRLEDIRFSSSPERIRVVFDLSDKSSFRDWFSADHQTLFIAIRNCRNISTKKPLKLKNPVLKIIEIEEQEETKPLLIKMSLEKEVSNYKTFSLRADQDKPFRIVVDLFPDDSATKAQSFQERAESGENRRRRIIVIDPGHGGEDPGAIGCNGIKEKDVVLKIAKELKAVINQSVPNTVAYLTRETDYFIPLQDRVKIAQKYKADIFVSVHINASRKKHIQGASVFYLSETGASDKAANLLAARENSSDLIAGINLSKNKAINSILIDLVQTYTLNESIRLCRSVLPGLLRHGFHNEGIKCANFAVLKSPSIPSVLLEIGYLTNTQDSNKINDQKEQRYIAEELAKSLSVYLQKDDEQQTMSQHGG